MKRIAFAALLLLVPTVTLAETRVPVSQSEISLGFAPLVKEAAPAVVNIYAKIITQGSSSPFRGDPFFEDFFRGMGPSKPRVQNSLGSGVILGEDGIVVSNYHVVGQATDIRVVLSDRREYTAKVLLADKEADLAILKLDGAEGLPSLKLRDSDQVEVGELVLAIGNPFGVGQTVSSGIVSGLARSGTATGNERGYFIQTDAPINPGNSGGALVDVNGDLIGINTSILTRSGGSNGIGFAIPANLVREFVHQAREGNDRFERPWAGVSGQAVDGDLAASLGLPAPEGILIADLHAASPLAQAGLEVGDVITDVDGLAVNSGQEMLFRMSVAGIGATADVTAWHEGKEQHYDVAMIAPPDTPAREAVTLDDKTVLPGLQVARANPAVISEYNLSLNTDGVVVTDPGPSGLPAGLQPGDVLLAINREDISAPADVAALLTDPGRRLLIELNRGGRRVSLRFRL
ncbi:MAG: serine protease [Rhodobacteraceae bacterium]|nr:serine protease [Paracoccaceae bacterium]MAY44270.1 serine protease [Paracoccaceae bacterium]QEW22115.1 putative periplasmic serine endoprotease DegP-like precursor [Marinibacterium anthonyi]